MSAKQVRTHEVTFCAQIKSWADALFCERPELGFRRVEIEESSARSRKRSDLRVYDAKGNLRLAGEVKLPGTPEGRNAFAHDLVDDAFRKAANAGAEFFFTWTVNDFVLFDAKAWQKQLMDKQVKVFSLGLDLTVPDDVGRPEVVVRVRAFLAEFFTEFSAILAGTRTQWATPLDVFFVRAFESHIDWPVQLAATHMHDRAATDKGFDGRLQEWLGREQGWQVLRQDVREWRGLLDRAARTLCYVFANRLLFYESVRAKHPSLEALSVPRHTTDATALYAHFQRAFQAAVTTTGDYETIFYPETSDADWTSPLVLAHADAAEAWRAVLANLQPFDFHTIRSDVLGSIFKRLIAPEERHKFGQHYTSEDLLDVVNAFCLRRGSAVLLDPACGSGSFLVRAYHRKAWLDPSLRHDELLRGVFGADIALFAAHLSTLNLAARDIKSDENYPFIRRGNFFEVAKQVHENRPFCRVPEAFHQDDGSRLPDDVYLPELDAVVGNPPYVRQELVPKRDRARRQAPMTTKEELADFVAQLWPGLALSRRSDLHCYFWPCATWRLKEGGWFGFLVSSGWLDVEYGFRLQEWVLQNFRIHAIIESNAEPWFEDARVKTCAVILQRCADSAQRQSQPVKFVRLDKPLAELLGARESEETRQRAADEFRDAIARCKEDTSRPGVRIIVKSQHDLWEEGLRAGRLFEEQSQRSFADGLRETAAAEYGDDGEDEQGCSDRDTAAEPASDLLHEGLQTYGPRYGGGKWGKYLRAPDLFFQIMRQYGGRFVPLGEIATIRRGITSGCDGFFMPHDVSADFLKRYDRDNWLNAPIMAACRRAEVEAGALRLIRAGDETVHPVEARYLAPEVHSPMTVRRPVLRADELDRFVLLVSEPVERLKGTFVAKYLRYGERATFASKKSKLVPVAQRSTCAGRQPWYDLTRTRRGHLVWSKSQQYRHIVVHNTGGLIVNCNLYDVTVLDTEARPPTLVAAVLNSTLVGYFKCFYGRYAGTEGNLKTEIVDVTLLDVPDPARATPEVRARLTAAFGRLCTRDTGELVEEEYRACHSSERAAKLAASPVPLPGELRQPDRRALDLAVFELLGVATPAEREWLCDELYREAAAHFRQIRIVEIQKQEQRSRSDGRGFRTDELAADVWDALAADERETLRDWVSRQSADALVVHVPEGRASLPDAADMFAVTTVFFRHAKATHALVLTSRPQAELAYALACEDVRGDLRLPVAAADAAALLVRLRDRIGTLATRADQLARSRTGDEDRIADLAALLRRWMIQGKPARVGEAAAHEEIGTD
jgi:hypothetical protein